MLKLGWGSGRFTQDHLYGHRSGVRACRLLPAASVLVTGSLDKTVRLWDLRSGLPVSESRAHGGTVRCVAVDDDTLVSGCTDGVLRMWHAGGAPTAAGEHGGAAAAAPLFDLASPATLLRDHAGPVSSLCMTEAALYSGSWDCTVRTYARGYDRHLAHSGGASASGRGRGLTLAATYSYGDFVASVAARGKHLLVAAGADVYCHDQATGQVVRRFQSLHERTITAVEGTQNSRMLFTGAGEGLVLAHDLRMQKSSCVVWHHNAGVTSLAFEDPWLASSSADGTLRMASRQLQAPSGPAYCVDLFDQWVACGSEAEVVRVWDFTAAGERGCCQQRLAPRNSRAHRRRAGRDATAAAAPAPPSAPTDADTVHCGGGGGDAPAHAPAGLGCGGAARDHRRGPRAAEAALGAAQAGEAAAAAGPPQQSQRAAPRPQQHRGGHRHRGKREQRSAEEASP
ncbi:hypothetical protein FOA52_011950 [Chlamydomonas sp. UWO 241]|nr:hypothetical protein FOA52_011950 [Chlamydomonas sp. UWO 241]